MANKKNNLIKDISIIVLSVVIAIIIANTQALTNIFTYASGYKLIGSFIAGLFFTSVFTVAPATVVLVKITETNSVFVVALLGGLGAMIGDLIIFRFVKDRLVVDIFDLIKQPRFARLKSILRLNIIKHLFPRWLAVLAGALIIASPLPDELGLTLMGLSKIKTAIFIPISFVLNFFGIVIIGIVAKYAF